MDLKDLLKRDLDDVIFEHRNKAYGAYALRKQYGRYIKNACVVGAAAFLLLVSSPLIADRIKPKSEALNMAAIEIKDLPPPENLPKPPPPPPPPPPPVRQIRTITFVPPRVVENTVEELEVPIVPDVKDAAIANKTQDGESAENLAPLTEVVPPSVAPPIEPEVVKEVEEKPFLIVEEKPEFPDGDRAMLQFLSKNLKYPAIAGK